MEGGRYWYKEVLPFTVMVGMECTNVGLNTLFKAATEKGMSYCVFVVYTYAIASFVLLPSPFFYRKSVLPPLSFWILAKLFLLGIIGSACLMVGYRGIQYSSPTLASAMSNLIPGFTFMLAIIFRMEKLAWRSSNSQAKIMGTLVSIAGALIVILVKGPAIILTAPRSSTTSQNFLHSSDSNWVIGGVLLLTEYILTPIWYILQAKIMKEYPAELVVVFFYNLFAGIISAAIAMVSGTDVSAWVLKPGILLVAVIYSGVLGSFLANSVHAWVLHRKGPVYIAMFKPVSIAIAAAMGVIFLGDTLHLGSIIGAAVISLGFYAVLWGKMAEEIYESSQYEDLESTAHRTPLLKRPKAEDN